MKRIIITVQDEVAGTIVGLVGEHAVDLRMELMDQPVKSGRMKKPRFRKERAPDEVLKFLKSGAKDRFAISDHLMNLGFAPSTGPTTASRLVKEGRVKFQDRAYRLVR